MVRSLLLVRHGDDPPDDRVFTFAVTRGFEPVMVKPFAGEALPPLDDAVAGIVVYGGKFNVFDTDLHPFLKDEARLIEQAIDTGLPLLGICQGAQQIAHTLGATVGPRPDGLHEFGYHGLAVSEEAQAIIPDGLVVAQAHFHGFDIPAGAVRLAGTPAFPNQAFRYGDRAFGLQFHPEVTIEGFRRWQDAPWAMYGKPGAQSRAEQDRLMAEHDVAQARWFYGFLDWLFATA